MDKLKRYIESGLLELYALGATSPKESRQVEAWLRDYEEIREQLQRIEQSVEFYAQANALAPNSSVKDRLLASIENMELEKSEFKNPPSLHKQSRISDYQDWLSLADMSPPENYDNISMKIIGQTPQITTMIVWIKNNVPKEVHHDEKEEFLIVEGTCDLILDGKIHKLVAGDYFSIPLHLEHSVKVTSKIPCKVILQRIAA